MFSTPLVKAYNFFYFSLLSIFISFLPVYLSTQGISTSRIGVIIGIGAFIGILSQPFWGVISDKYKTIKKIILITLGISIGVGVTLFQTSSLVPLMILVFLMYIFYLPTDPLTESLNYQISQKLQVSFGSIRMFGAIGYATASLLVGFASDYWGIHSLAWLFAGYGLLTFVTGLALPDAPAASKPISLTSLKLFVTYPKALWFFLLVLITALPHRMNDSFLGVYIQSLGGGTSLIGQAWFIAAISEVFFFAVSYKFLRKGKELQLISIASVLYMIRYFLCSIVTEPEWVVYLQLMQGVTFVVFYTAAIQYLYLVIPEEWKATGQTILAILFFGISGIFGSFIGGWVFDRFGGAALYQTMATLSLISFLFSLMINKRLPVSIH
ncbi:MFS transporter [Brevibacillus ginsengisoli]|uniref:MFS transporter n=1 Tax=Brevibacillus ginsengisoli TaxID=363854 RepID=UPI003CF7BDC2